MKNCLNCKYGKVVERFTWNRDGNKMINTTCFECSANEYKQYYLKPVVKCDYYVKGRFILDEQ